MASTYPVTPNRTVELSVGGVHILLGLVLTVFVNHYIRDFPILLAPKWYDSYWLPLSVACVICAFEAVLIKLPADWLFGLLLTAPPYGWHACLATVLYFENRKDTTATEYLKIALPALLLALSGAFLKPIIARLVPARFGSSTTTASSKR